MPSNKPLLLIVPSLKNFYSQTEICRPTVTATLLFQSNCISLFLLLKIKDVISFVILASNVSRSQDKGCKGVYDITLCSLRYRLTVKNMAKILSLVFGLFHG